MQYASHLHLERSFLLRMHNCLGALYLHAGEKGKGKSGKPLHFKVGGLHRFQLRL